MVGRPDPDDDWLLDDRTHWSRLLGSPPWRRAPLLLRRQPGVLVALAAAAAILGLAGASGPLFLSSAGAAELAVTVRDACPENSAVGVSSGPDSLTSTDPDNASQVTVDTAGQDRTVRAALHQVGLPAPYRVVLAAAQLDVPGAASPYPAVLYARAGVDRHLPVARRNAGDGRGVWLPASTTRTLNAPVGTSVTIAGTPVPVAGLYRDIDGGIDSDIDHAGKVPRYWCSWSPLVQPSASTNSAPLLVPVDPATIEALRVHRVGQWFSPIGTDLTVRSGRQALRRAAALPDAIQAVAEGADSFGLTVTTTGLTGDVSRAELASRGLRGPVLPVAVTGTLVALLLVGASGGYWAERRAAEVRLLAARGVPPAALGVKAVLETAPAVLVGLAGGWAAALALVPWLGPSPLLEDGAGTRALATVGAVGAAGLLVLGSVTGVRAWAAVSRRRRRLRGRAWRRLRLWRVLPWELAMVALATLLYQQARHRGVVTDRFLVQIPPRLVAFPLLGLAGALLFVARIGIRPMPALRRATARVPAAAWLASRRITAAPVVFLALLVATAMPVGLLTYAATLSRSTGDTVQRKAELNLGARHVLVTDAAGGRRLDTGGRGTQVSVITDASVAGDTEAQVLGIDPAAFGRYAVHTGARLDDLLAALRDPPAGGAVPAILVNPPDRAPVHLASFDGVSVPVRVVATEPTFPGLRAAAHPMLVMPFDALGHVGPYTRRQEEVWTTPAGAPAVRAALRAGGVRVPEARTPADVLSATDLVTVTWALDFLQALALLAGVIVAAGLLLYLATRQRGRVVAYVLGRRLGMRRRTHLASLLLEVGAALGLGWLLGLAGGLVSVWLVVPIFDVNPQYPPGGTVSYPVTAVAGVALALGAVAALCALSTQYTADRTPPGVVTRIGA